MNDFVAGLVGGSLGLVVGHPLDTLKAVMQTRDQTRMFSAARSLMQKTQWKGFFRGLGLPFFCYGPQNSAIFGIYASTLRALEPSPSSSDGYKLSHVFLAGTVAGGATVIMNNPLELIKIQLQTHDKGEIKGIMQCTKNIINNHGFRGLFRGILSLFHRDFYSYGAYFFIFEYVRREMKTLGSASLLLNDFVAGGFAGSLAWFLVIPIDMAKSQIQSDFKMDTSIRKIFREMYRKFGFRGYFIGAWPAVIRGFIVNGVTFVGYVETLKLLESAQAQAS